MTKLMTVLALALAAQTAFAETTPFDNIKARTEALQIAKGELLKDIALNTVLADSALDQSQLIEEYAQSRGTIYQNVLDFIGSNPASVDSTFIASVTAASVIAQRTLISPVLVGEAGNVVSKLMQRFPKMSKAAPWVATVATAAVVIRQTIRLANMMQFDGMTATELTNLYARKLQDYNLYRDNVVNETRELQKVAKELNQLLPADEAKTAKYPLH